MTPQQYQGVEAYVRDGRPLDQTDPNWLFRWEDAVKGEGGQILPTVFFAEHSDDSKAQVRRSVVPSHLVYPGLAHGPNAQARTDTPLAMNDPTPDCNLLSDAPAFTTYPELRDSEQLSPNFFIASPFPGAPYYGQTRRSPYNRAYYREMTMSSANTVIRADAVENDHAGDLDSNLQTNISRQASIDPALFVTDMVSMSYQINTKY